MRKPMTLSIVQTVPSQSKIDLYAYTHGQVDVPRIGIETLSLIRVLWMTWVYGCLKSMTTLGLRPASHVASKSGNG